MSELAIRRYAVSLPNLPPSLDGLTIAHVSDFHFRRWNQLLERAQDALAHAEVGLLTATGDYCHHKRGWKRAAALMARFLEPIRTTMGSFACLGNHDNPRLAECWKRGSLTLLRNRTVQVAWEPPRRRSQPGTPRSQSGINVAGIEQIKRDGGDPEACLRRCRSGWPTIMLAHFPSTIHWIRSRWTGPGQRPDERTSTSGAVNVDLLLCGHTHGGQWRFGKLGCFWTNDQIDRQHAYGLHRIGSTYMHVTAGIGTSGPFRLRINCPAEVAIIRLRRAEPDPDQLGGRLDPSAPTAPAPAGRR